ncbi:MAG: LutB/LldF family L-lactate oxidation iron-sulfur protein [Acidobacteriota bacterium]
MSPIVREVVIPMQFKPRLFKRYAADNVHNSQLRKAYRFATHHALQKRADVVKDVPEWEALRTRAHLVKQEAIEHLDVYLERFEQQVQSVGGHVFWARDGREARDYILGVARRIGARNIVKSKSMTTEEIGLSQFLQESGIRTVETDLGEYIIQLAGETPSHLTAPALHKTREEIGELFANKLGIPFTSVPEELCAVARGLLREQFLSADLGISGCNFGLADTGTVVVVENEGNARLSTTLPRVHIAVMGLEKIIPSFTDLPVFLKLLARSSTGQKQTVYVSMINSARRKDDLDGPEEFHVVLLDNGRTEILADPKMRESLYCIRCGACLNTCPIYQRVGGHAYGSVYSGPIGAAITPVYQGIQEAQDLPFASSLCGACANICPVKIDIHHLLLWLRRQVVETLDRPWRERLLMKLYLMGMKDETLYRMGSALLRVALSFTGNGKGQPRVPGWTETRDFPPLADKTFKQLWKESTRGSQR